MPIMGRDKGHGKEGRKVTKTRITNRRGHNDNLGECKCTRRDRRERKDGGAGHSWRTIEGAAGRGRRGTGPIRGTVYKVMRQVQYVDPAQTPDILRRLAEGRREQEELHQEPRKVKRRDLATVTCEQDGKEIKCEEEE